MTVLFFVLGIGGKALKRFTSDPCDPPSNVIPSEARNLQLFIGLLNF
jgi:hypothetical protein